MDVRTDGAADEIGVDLSRRGGWTRVAISCVEDLSDAVLGAGLEAMQMSRARYGQPGIR